MATMTAIRVPCGLARGRATTHTPTSFSTSSSTSTSIKPRINTVVALSTTSTTLSAGA
jgi:hypothetical protein